jgi:hypothetical protein
MGVLKKLQDELSGLFLCVFFLGFWGLALIWDHRKENENILTGIYHKAELEILQIEQDFSFDLDKYIAENKEDNLTQYDILRIEKIRYETHSKLSELRRGLFKNG